MRQQLICDRFLILASYKKAIKYLKKLETNPYAFATDTDEDGALKSARIAQALLMKQLKEAENNMKANLVNRDSSMDLDLSPQPGTSRESDPGAFNFVTNIMEADVIFDGVIDNTGILQKTPAESSISCRQKPKPSEQKVFTFKTGKNIYQLCFFS